MKKKKKLKWRDRFKKKIINIMAGFDIDELMSIKNAYQGQKFQWIKPDDKSRLAKVVTVTDVIPGKRMNTVNGVVQQYAAVLSDGSRIDTERLTNNLMMLHEEQEPMTMQEVLSIYQEPELDVKEVKQALPEDYKKDSTLPDQNTNPANMPISQLKNIDPSQLQQPQRNQQALQERTTVEIDTRSLFGMFEVKETSLNLKVDVPLPAKNLLKMMFTNSQDKDKFIEQLAAHINNSITPAAIQESVNKMMGYDKNKTNSEDGE